MCLQPQLAGPKMAKTHPETRRDRMGTETGLEDLAESGAH